MIFSVLIPTRNRAEYLRYAIESVRRQSYSAWELIICDNASTDDTELIIKSYGDPRIRYSRSDTCIPVTENWNRAVSQVTGEYFIVLGDDDCLMADYFKTMLTVISKFDAPDLIYTSAYRFAYPNAVPDRPNGFFEEYGFARFLRRATTPYLLTRKTARALVNKSLRFVNEFAFNMQYVLVSKRLIPHVTRGGSFFQSPFPDFYAMNALFLKAQRILIYPSPMVTIGITPKSYGHYYLSGREAEGEAFLLNSGTATPSHLKDIVLPGSRMYTNWLIAMDALQRAFPEEHLRVNYRRYRMIQIYHGFEQFFVHRVMSPAQFQQLLSRITWFEKLLYGYSIVAIWFLRKILKPAFRAIPANLRTKLVSYFNLHRGHPVRWNNPSNADSLSNLLDVYERVRPRTP